MSSKGGHKSKPKKPLQTTLGKAPLPDSNELSIDLSSIRKPIDTSVFGLRQVLSLFETATDEVRRYITYECDIMYECRTCRSIFRSLANFILHKRDYCRESYSPLDNNTEDECEENGLEITCQNYDKTMSTKTSPKGKSSEVKEFPKKSYKKTLSTVLKTLADKQECTKFTAEVMSETISNDSEQVDGGDPKRKVALEKIESNDAGVFQTLHNKTVGDDFMKTEVMEIHGILNKTEAILGPDGKVVSLQGEKKEFQPGAPKYNLMCTICDLKFSTKKTLAYHIKYKHNNNKVVYVCPECRDTFVNAWCVFRHLYKVHRKSSSQIRKLREQIHGSAIAQDMEVLPKKKTVKPIQMENYDQENQWINDFESDNDLQMCGGCGKRFERKAALNSHSQTCLKRLAVCNTVRENKRIEEEKLNKQKMNPVAVPVSGAKKRKSAVLRKSKKYVATAEACPLIVDCTNEQDKTSKCNEESIGTGPEAASGIKPNSGQEENRREEVNVKPHDQNIIDCNSIIENDAIISEEKGQDESTSKTINKVEYKRTAIEEIIFGRTTQLPGIKRCSEQMKDVIIEDEADMTCSVASRDEENTLGFSLFSEDVRNTEASEETVIGTRIECEVTGTDFGGLKSSDRDEEFLEGVPDCKIQLTSTGESPVSSEARDANKFLGEKATDSKVNEVCSSPKSFYGFSSKLIEGSDDTMKPTRGCNISKVSSDETTYDIQKDGSSNENLVPENKLIQRLRKMTKGSDLKRSVCNDHRYISNVPLHRKAWKPNILKRFERHSNRHMCIGVPVENKYIAEDIKSLLDQRQPLNVTSNQETDPEQKNRDGISEHVKSPPQNSANVIADLRADLEQQNYESVLKDPEINLERQDCGLKIDPEQQNPESIAEHSKIDGSRKIDLDHVGYQTHDPTQIDIAKLLENTEFFGGLREMDMNTVSEFTEIKNVDISSEFVEIKNEESEDGYQVLQNGQPKMDTERIEVTRRFEDKVETCIKFKEKTENQGISLLGSVNEQDAITNSDSTENGANSVLKEKVYMLYSDNSNSSSGCMNEPKPVSNNTDGKFEDDSLKSENATDKAKSENRTVQLGSPNVNDEAQTAKRKCRKRKNSVCESSKSDSKHLTLEMKSEKYVNMKKLLCIPCKVGFSSKRSLMSHMSRHFRWFCFQCSKCLFMSYDKLTCVEHISVHKVHPTLLDNIVLPIPHWKTVNLCTNFVALQVSGGLIKQYEKETEENEKKAEGDTFETADKHNPLLRKMIMEVIFGSQSSSENAVQKNPAASDNVRPVRNRTSVVQKDFVYDFKKIDSKIKERRASAETRVKPIKLVKGAGTNFKVLHVRSDVTYKKRKECYSQKVNEHSSERTSR